MTGQEKLQAAKNAHDDDLLFSMNELIDYHEKQLKEERIAGGAMGCLCGFLVFLSLMFAASHFGWITLH